MRKREKLDNILNECLERVLLAGESVEECLQSYPDYAEELRPLLDTVLSARQVSDIEPRAEFKSRARYEFQQALREKAEKKSRGWFSWQPAWSAVVASIVTFILVSGVTVGAAGNSMPDQPLYPVKLATEQLQLTITRSPLSKAELYVRLADKRVAEIVYLASKDKSEEIESVTRRLDTNLEKIAVLSMAPGAREDRGDVTPAKPEAIQEPPPRPGLMLAPAEPPEGQAPPSEAAPRRPALSERTPLKAPSQQPGSRVEPPTEKTDEEAISIERLQQIKDRAKLRAVIARYAENHTDKLRKALKNAPPSVKQALLRAIAVSEARYKEADKALEGEQNDSEQVPPETAPKRPQGNLTPRKIAPAPRTAPEPTKVAPQRPLDERNSSPEPSRPSRNRAESYKPQPETEAGVNNIEQANDVERRKATIVPYNRNRSEELREALKDAPETDGSTGSPADTASSKAID